MPTHLTYQYLCKRKSPPIHRPLVPVQLIGPKGDMPFEIMMLLDTGADDCVLDQSLAKILGIDLSQCARETAQGIGGKEDGYTCHGIAYHLLKEEGGEVADVKRHFTVTFLPRIATRIAPAFGIFGQSGFFEFYEVRFNLALNEFRIIP